MDYYDQLYWMIPLAILAFALALFVFFAFYKKGYFDKWLGL